MTSISLLLAMAAAPVSYSTSATPAGRLLPELGKQIGQNLAASPELAAEVLLIHVKDVEPERILQQIATVTWGAWKTDANGVRTLVPDAALRARLKAEKAAEERAIRLKGIQRMLTVPKEYPGDLNTRVLRTILQGFGAKFLADIPDGRIVFSTTPTPMQRPLSGFQSQWVQGAVAEHNVQAETAAKNDADMAEVEEAMGKMTAEQKEFFKKIIDSQKPKKMALEDVSKALIIITRAGESINAEYKLVYGNGKLLPLSQLDAYGGSAETEEMDSPEEAETAKPDAKPATPVAPDDKFEPSKRSIELYQMWTKQGSFSMADPSSRKELKVSPELEAALVGPQSVDLSALADEEFVLAVARRAKANLIANLNEDVSPALINNRMVSKLKEGLEEEYDIDEKGAGWITFRSGDGPQNRADRTILATLMTEFRGKPLQSLDDKAKYALLIEPIEDPFQSVFVLAQAYAGIPPYFGDLDALRFYGRLSAQQKQQAAKGLEIPFASLSASQKKTVFTYSFGPYPQLMPPSALGKSTIFRNFDFDNIETMFSEMGGGEMGMEPTEVIPSGVANSVVRVTMVDEEAIRMSSPGQPDSAMTLSFKEAAFALGMVTQMNIPEAAAMVPTSGTLGRRKQWSFQFLFSPLAATERQLSDDLIDPNAKAVPIKDLGPEFQAQMKAASEKMKKFSWLFQGGFGFGGRGMIPPQR